MSMQPGDKALTWEARFWRRVEKTDGCWLWHGGTGGRGVLYGVWRYPSGRRTTAHRIAYELLLGPIPDGHHPDHLCENGLCVNPAHLEPVTPEVNNLRSRSLTAALAQQTHCKRGHPLSGDNLYRYQGQRKCRACRNLQNRQDATRKRRREWMRRKRAERSRV